MAVKNGNETKKEEQVWPNSQIIRKNERLRPVLWHFVSPQLFIYHSKLECLSLTVFLFQLGTPFLGKGKIVYCKESIWVGGRIP